METKELNCKIILRSEKEITSDDILRFEILLNDSMAVQTWIKMAIGARFHISMEINDDTESIQKDAF